MSKIPSLPWTDAAAHWLEGRPNFYITLALVGLAGIFAGIAFWGPMWLKALVLAWAILP